LKGLRPFKLPLINNLCIREFKRGVSPSFINIVPLPLTKGKGIKGIGLINNPKANRF
jgi:hypothetical protein